MNGETPTLTPAVLLEQELHRRIRKNPRYSLRAYASALGFSPGELSEILRGKRRLTAKALLKIARVLCFSPEMTERFLRETVPEKKERSTRNKSALPVRPLTVDFFHVVSDWYCFAILNLADTEGFRGDPKWIARRLGLTVTETKLALARLKRLGLLREEGGKLEAVSDYVISPDGIPSEAIRNYHRQILEKAAESLETQSVTEREIAGVGFAFDPKRLPELKKEIHSFLDRVVRNYAPSPGSEKPGEVYHLETSFFRMTQPQPRSTKP